MSNFFSFSILDPRGSSDHFCVYQGTESPLIQNLPFLPLTFIYIIGTTIALREFTKKLLDVFCILTDTLLVAIIAINQNNQITRIQRHLRTFVVTGWRTYTTLGITIDG